MDKQYDKRIRRTRRRSESGNTHRSTQNNTKKYQIGKRQTMMKYMASGSRQALGMNRCLQGEHVPKWMAKKKRPH